MPLPVQPSPPTSTPPQQLHRMSLKIVNVKLNVKGTVSMKIMLVCFLKRSPVVFICFRSSSLMTLCKRHCFFNYWHSENVSHDTVPFINYWHSENVTRDIVPLNEYLFILFTIYSDWSACWWAGGRSIHKPTGAVFTDFKICEQASISHWPIYCKWTKFVLNQWNCSLPVGGHCSARSEEQRQSAQRLRHTRGSGNSTQSWKP